MSPEEAVALILALSRKCRYAALLDNQGRKMAEDRRKDRKPLYEFDAAAVENTRTVFRFDTAKMRASHSGPLHAVVALYEDEYTLTVATQAGVLFASFDPPIEPSIIEQIVKLSKFRLS